MVEAWSRQLLRLSLRAAKRRVEDATDVSAVMRSALSPLAKPLPKDPRSAAAKRRADALVELARRVLNAGTLPVEGGVRPHVGLTVDVAESRRHSGVVDLDWGGTVSIQTARRTCCDAEIIPS